MPKTVTPQPKPAVKSVAFIFVSFKGLSLAFESREENLYDKQGYSDCI